MRFSTTFFVLMLAVTAWALPAQASSILSSNSFPFSSFSSPDTQVRSVVRGAVAGNWEMALEGGVGQTQNLFGRGDDILPTGVNSAGAPAPIALPFTFTYTASTLTVDMFLELPSPFGDGNLSETFTLSQFEGSSDINVVQFFLNADSDTEIEFKNVMLNGHALGDFTANGGFQDNFFYNSDLSAFGDISLTGDLFLFEEATNTQDQRPAITFKLINGEPLVTQPIPVPAAVWLLGAGLAGLLARRR